MSRSRAEAGDPGVTAVEERIRVDLAAALHRPVLDVRPIPEGHSGFTYWVDLEQGRAVLRLPPPGTRIAGPADIPRQGRIMAALHALGIPAPAVLAMSEEPVVDGRPFVVMDAVAGKRIEEVNDEPAHLAAAAIKVLKALQAVPLAQTGIAQESPVSLVGELSRWAWLMERAPAELTGAAPALRDRLAAGTPPQHPPVLVHGDYHFGNMLFDLGKVSAVLDWEIAELGDPLLDACCLCVVFQGNADGDPGWGGGTPVDPDAVAHMMGADAQEFHWALALTYYKYAAILGYNLMLHRRGKRPDPSYERRTGTITGFIEAGLRLMD